MKTIRFALPIALVVLAALPTLGRHEHRFDERVREDISARGGLLQFHTGPHFEMQYEQTSQSEYATRSIEAYKRPIRWILSRPSSANGWRKCTGKRSAYTTQ